MENVYGNITEGNVNVAIVGIALITDLIIREGKSKIVWQETVEDGILYVDFRGEWK